MQSIKAILPVFILWIITVGAVHAQSWQWAVSGGSMGGEGSPKHCIDDSGYLYSTGQFSIQQFVFGGKSLSTHGSSDIYLTKIDPFGNILWLKGITSDDYPVGSSGDYPCDIRYNNISKTILVCGVLNGSNCKVVNCDAGGGEFAFISRLDTDGNCLWTQTIIRNGDIHGMSLEESDDGFIYLTADASSNCIANNQGFPPGSILAKYRSEDGSCLWAKYISTVSIGNIRYYEQKLYVGGMSEQKEFKLAGVNVSGNVDDIYIAGFDTSGGLNWVKTYGGAGYDAGGWINMDQEGNIYTTGTFQDTAWFDKIRITTPFTNDWFLLKTDKSGNALWVEQGHIQGKKKGHGRTRVDKQGSILAIGRFSDAARFGTFNIISKTTEDMFIVKYSNNGECENIAQIPQVLPSGIVCDHDNNVIIGGGFYNTITIGQNSLTSIGGLDVMFAKFSWKPGTGEPGNPESENALTIYANPTTGLCTVKVPEALLNEAQCSLQLTDMHGKIVENAVVDLESGKVQIDLQQKAKGVYHVLLRGKDQVYKGKIVFY